MYRDTELFLQKSGNWSCGYTQPLQTIAREAFPVPLLVHLLPMV